MPGRKLLRQCQLYHIVYVALLSRDVAEAEVDAVHSLTERERPASGKLHGLTHTDVEGKEYLAILIVKYMDEEAVALAGGDTPRTRGDVAGTSAVDGLAVISAIRPSPRDAARLCRAVRRWAAGRR